jgi:outer membrane protein assembly factor BamE
MMLRRLSANYVRSTTLMNHFNRSILLAAALWLTSACVYRINIQQGNFLDQAAVEQVKVGMTRSQVRYLLGTPMVADTFNKERWDYIYYLKKGHSRKVDSRRVTVYFDVDKVAKIDKPSAAVAAAQDASAAAVKTRQTF